MLYREETNGSSKPVPIPTRTYDRFIREQIDWRETPAGECQGLFWKETLSEQFPLLDLPTDRPHRVAPSFKTEYLPFAIPVAPRKSMRSLARDANVRPLVLWLSAWFVFLHRMGGQSDLVTTLPVAGRGREYDGVLGFFVNNLPIRVQCLGEERFQTFSKHVADALETALAHQDWPFSLMTRGMDISTFSSLSQTGFAWQNFNRFGKRRSVLVTASGETGEIWHVGGMEWELIRHWHQSQEPDIQLHLMNLPDNQYGIWRYASDLFDRSTIERWSGHFVRLLEGIVAEPTAKISRLPLLTEAEKQRILVEWNDTKVPYPQGKCVHELFEDRAAKTPDAVALVFEDLEVSYGELNARANRLAHRLRTLGVGPEALVGLFVERSVEMIVGLLAILKAGGAYVPLDPEYPKDRLAFMAEDAGLKVLLCHGATRDRLPECPARILDMDTEAAAIAGENPDNPAQLATSDNLAYVIYTSGSTGKPKGVMIEHEGLINLAMAQAHIFHVDPSSRVLQFASISFDAAIWEILMAFQAGAALCLADKASLLLGAALRDTLIRRAITHVTLPPSALTVLSTAEEIPALSTLITAGEACPIAVAREWTRKARYFNAYGPTETTVCASILAFSGEDETLSIGHPIANIQTYILDSNLQPLPIGVSGELYIGGAGVARGYLNRPDLTAERFIPDPFSNDPDARLYRTGDLCRWLPDGTIEYLGRIDTQVKIRGFRIECGEVENALLVHPNVREAVVDARGEGLEKQLVAWVVGDVGGIHESPLRDALRTHPRGMLPDWMVPSVFVFVESLPLTPSGKIDRKALPAPDASDFSAREFVAPATPTEELLANLWAAVLKREGIGRFDNFFDLGGHSLLATQLVSRIRDGFQVELPVRAVFEHPELSALAEAISSSGAGKRLPPIEPQPVDAPKALSFAQQRLWFLDRYEGGGTATYNIPIALRLSGDLDVDALRASLSWMVERHEALRTYFPNTEGEARAEMLSVSAFEFPIHDLRHLPPKEKKLQQRVDEHAMAPFDLGRGPLFRAEILRLGEHHGRAVHVLLLNMHHIIGDGWSLRVFVREWKEAYGAFSRGETPNVPPLPCQYSDYAAWQRQWLRDEVLEEQFAYWKDNLAGIPELLELPTDHPRPAQQSYRGAHRFQTLPCDVTAAIEAFSREQGVTLFMTLLAAFDVLLARYSGQDDICVGSPIANRTRTDMEGLIGFFVNTLVLRARLNPDWSFRELLGEVRRVCLGAYAHQDIPFEALVERLNPARSLSHGPPVPGHAGIAEQ
uniref:Amino acid adenylation domain-containing protein n=1 Tax=Candidatus Kentrum sp. TC TaxID=2126339 RepID=A0A450ZJ77_9GAMM|nr:MAG: amino acid adenylation domain-containing protein [Candidatus Kentron sp. TC]